MPRIDAIFVTYTTIGLGDFVPEPKLEYVWSLEVLLGLALFAALVQVETEEFEELEQKVEEKATTTEVLSKPFVVSASKVSPKNGDKSCQLF